MSHSTNIISLFTFAVSSRLYCMLISFITMRKVRLKGGNLPCQQLINHNIVRFGFDEVSVSYLRMINNI